MFRTTLAAAALVFVSMAVEADVRIGPDVITTHTKVEVLGPGPDLQAIIDGITDAGPSKPYLIKLGPGVYPLTTALIMKHYISITGSGQEATTLTGAISTGSLDASSAIVVGAGQAALTHLSVENTGSNTYSVAILNIDVNARIRNVFATASGTAAENYGVLNNEGSPTMFNVVANALEGTINRGVYNIDSNPRMSNVTAQAFGSNGAADNCGVLNVLSSRPIMNNVTASASGGAKNYGVSNNASSPTMNNVTVLVFGGMGGADNRGVFNENGSNPIMTLVSARAFLGTVNYGVSNNASSPTMNNVTASVSGTSGSSDRGVSNENGSNPIMTLVSARTTGAGAVHDGVLNSNSSPRMVNVTAFASGGVSNYGVRNLSASDAPWIEHSSLEGSTAGMLFQGLDTGTRITNSNIKGPMVNDPTGTQCRGNYDVNLNDVTC